MKKFAQGSYLEKHRFLELGPEKVTTGKAATAMRTCQKKKIYRGQNNS